MRVRCEAAPAGGLPVLTDEQEEEEAFVEGCARLGNRHVGLTKLSDGRFVSTVVLAEYLYSVGNVEWARASGLVDLVENPYETMVTPGWSHERRYKNLREARSGHQLLVDELGGAAADQSNVVEEFHEANK